MPSAPPPRGGPHSPPAVHPPEITPHSASDTSASATLTTRGGGGPESAGGGARGAPGTRMLPSAPSPGGSAPSLPPLRRPGRPRALPAHQIAFGGGGGPGRAGEVGEERWMWRRMRERSGEMSCNGAGFQRRTPGVPGRKSAWMHNGGSDPPPRESRAASVREARLEGESRRGRNGGGGGWRRRGRPLNVQAGPRVTNRPVPQTKNRSRKTGTQNGPVCRRKLGPAAAEQGGRRGSNGGGGGEGGGGGGRQENLSESAPTIAPPPGWRQVRRWTQHTQQKEAGRRTGTRDGESPKYLGHPNAPLLPTPSSTLAVG